MQGILNIDKPAGITSMEMVRRVKRASRQKRVGHGGTLDPVATGVVPICIGQATRMMEFLIEGTKEYSAVIRLGVETDTYDSMGQVTRNVDPSIVTLRDVEGALKPFEGAIEQVPPMYSALKRQGKRLYELARAGIEIDREPRKVQVHKVELRDWCSPLVTVNVTCGRGFYMRSLAHDLGQALDCGGHLEQLVRLRNGPFRISEAISLEGLEQKCADGTWRESIYAPDVVVEQMRSVIVERRAEDMIMHGSALPPGLGIPFSIPDEKCRVYSTDGRFIGVLSFDASRGQWQPARVFAFSDGGN